MLVCQPGQVALHRAGARAGLQPDDAGAPPPPAPGPPPAPPRPGALTAAFVMPGSFPGPTSSACWLQPRAPHPPRPCEWAAELLPSASSVTASRHCHHTRTALNRGTKG